MALRAFPLLSTRYEIREGERHQRGGAALARWLLAWAVPVCMRRPWRTSFTIKKAASYFSSIVGSYFFDSSEYKNGDCGHVRTHAHTAR